MYIPYCKLCRCCTNWDARWRMRWQSQQHGLERYNCADSLDRTNAASYFGAVQVFAYPCCCSFIVVGCGELPDLPSQRCTVAGVCLKPTGKLGVAYLTSAISQKCSNSRHSFDRGQTGQGVPVHAPRALEECVECNLFLLCLPCERCEVAQAHDSHLRVLSSTH